MTSCSGLLVLGVVYTTWTLSTNRCILMMWRAPPSLSTHRTSTGLVTGEHLRLCALQVELQRVSRPRQEIPWRRSVLFCSKHLSNEAHCPRCPPVESRAASSSTSNKPLSGTALLRLSIRLRRDTCKSQRSSPPLSGPQKRCSRRSASSIVHSMYAGPPCLHRTLGWKSVTRMPSRAVRATRFTGSFWADSVHNRTRLRMACSLRNPGLGRHQQRRPALGNRGRVLNSDGRARRKDSVASGEGLFQSSIPPHVVTSMYGVR